MVLARHDIHLDAGAAVDPAPVPKCLQVLHPRRRPHGAEVTGAGEMAPAQRTAAQRAIDLGTTV